MLLYFFLFWGEGDLVENNSSKGQNNGTSVLKTAIPVAWGASFYMVFVASAGEKDRKAVQFFSLLDFRFLCS